jgi:hypothetical protein
MQQPRAVSEKEAGGREKEAGDSLWSIRQPHFSQQQELVQQTHQKAFWA